MKVVRKKSRKPVRAAGGIVLGAASEPLFAVVQMRKFDAWVLPKGKLNRGETALEAARREVREETGYEVSVHEFAGTLAYEVGGRPKIVQFWRMQALSDAPAYALMDDIRAVRFLPLGEAVGILTHLREREFLRDAGTAIIAAAKTSVLDQGGWRQATAPAAFSSDPSGTAHDRVESPNLGAANWCRALVGAVRGWWRRIKPAGAQSET